MEHVLGRGHESVEHLRCAVFAHLLQMADGVVNAYRSDLYHDALWLSSNLTQPRTFYWACDESGTNIGEYEASMTREHRYRCVVAVSEKRVWTLTVTGA